MIYRITLESKIVRFAMVGAVGFIINALILFTLFEKLGLHLIVSQVIAGECAIISNFVFHYNWTFREKRGMLYKKLLEFHLSSWAGFLITLSILSISVYLLKLNYLIGIALGGATAMTWNFLWSYLKIWNYNDK